MMVQERHRRGDRILAIRTVDGAGVGILADAARVAKALAPTDARHHRGGQSLGDQRRTLLDVQLQEGADPRRIEEAPPAANRLRVEAALDQRGFEGAPVVRALDREAGGVEQSKGAAAADIGDVEPGGLLGANAHDREIVRGLDARAS